MANIPLRKMVKRMGRPDSRANRIPVVYAPIPKRPPCPKGSKPPYPNKRLKLTEYREKYKISVARMIRDPEISRGKRRRRRVAEIDKTQIIKTFRLIPFLQKGPRA
jgi:hypothetical protein